MSYTLTILGCGSSGGVPRIGNDWGVCDPAEPRNRRSRCSILVRHWGPGAAEPTLVLVDTSPDMREQLLGANVTRLDAVLITHEHDIAQFAGRVVAFRDGRIVSDQPVVDRRMARPAVGARSQESAA